MSQEIRYFDYVNHPYDKVSETLTSSAQEVFQAATSSATSRASDVAAALHVKIAGIDIATDIAITIKGVETIPAEVQSPARTVLHLEWEAASSPRLFPFMSADLLIYPLTATETQLELSGTYVPPGGVLGSAIDAVVGHRVAESSVHSFISDVAAHLRKTLR